MVELPKDRLLDLRVKVEQQRNTVEALRRDGHEFTDAERHLRQLQTELRNIDPASSRAPPGVGGSAATSS